MLMVCPQCTTSHEQRLHCPVCSTRLVLAEPKHGPASAVQDRRSRYPTWARIFVGLVLSQGLFYALRQLATGVLLACEGDDAQVFWGSVSGFLLIQALQLVALLMGSMLTGSTHDRGAILGMIVGVWNGVFSVLLQRGPAQQLTAIALYGQPLIQALFGALGGWLGSVFWKPIQKAAVARHEPATEKQVRKPRRPLLAGRVAWFRVAVGSAVAILGTIMASALFDLILDLSNGKLATTDDLQDRLVTWEIKALAVLLGGAFAGATTSNGVKQGLFVGLSTSIILLVLRLATTSQSWQLTLLTLVSAFPLGLTGGWFGSQLFPPVVKFRRRGTGTAAWNT